MPFSPREALHRVAVGAGCLLALYFLIAYLLLPRGTERYASKHPSWDDDPRITLTGDKHPGDPLNIALIGTKDEVQQAFAAAKWFSANPLGLKSDVAIAVDTVLKRPDQQAPVSNLFLFGRKEDLAFEKPVGNNPRQRHHVRFWRGPEDDSGRPIWFGSATFDERVGFSHTTGQITHHISGDVDAERDSLLADLKQGGGVVETEFVPDFHANRIGRNGGGDAWHTDGSLAVGVLKGE